MTDRNSDRGVDPTDANVTLPGRGSRAVLWWGLARCLGAVLTASRAGGGGGRLVVEGRPEDVAALEESGAGRYL